MAHEGEKLLIYFESEADIVGRLGAAVISCWPRLPGSIQKMLVEQSSKVLDDEETSEFERRLEAFIKQHTGGK
jgi:hypothetical protein